MIFGGSQFGRLRCHYHRVVAIRWMTYYHNRRAAPNSLGKFEGSWSTTTTASGGGGSFVGVVTSPVRRSSDNFPYSNRYQVMSIVIALIGYYVSDSRLDKKINGMKKDVVHAIHAKDRAKMMMEHDTQNQKKKSSFPIAAMCGMLGLVMGIVGTFVLRRK